MGQGWARLHVTAVAIAIALAGCGSPATDAGSRSDPSPSPSDPSPSPSDPSPSPSESPAYLYTCGRFPFHPALLETHGDVERQDSDVGRALRDLFEHPDGAYLERSEGWRVTYEDEERVEVLAGTAQDGFVDAAFERSGDSLEPAGWGDCQPQVYVGNRSPVAWELDRAPAPDDTQLRVEAYDVGCSGGRKLTQDITTYEVDYAEDAVSILITGDPHMGGDCVGRSWPLTIELAEPVGDRTLLDAVHYPPKQRHP